ASGWTAPFSMARCTSFANEVWADTADIAEVVNTFKPNVLVLDIEGAEIEVLARCPLNDIERIIVETHPRIVGDEATPRMFDALRSAGFDERACLKETVHFERKAAPIIPDRQP